MKDSIHEDQLICWKWAAARVRGEWHEAQGLPVQDAYAVAQKPGFLFMAVADGAGSSTHGGIGAILLVRHLRTRFLQHSDREPGLEALRLWVLEADEKLRSLAPRRQCDSRAFSTTLAAVIATRDTFHVAQVGDSVVAAAGSNDEWDLLCWPKNGEHSNVTFFLPLREGTDLHLHTFRHMRACFSLALFTDGISDLCISEEGVLSSFLNFWQAPLLNRNGCGLHHDISQAMRRRLREDPAIRKRLQSVGDDRTLLVARKAPCRSVTL